MTILLEGPHTSDYSQNYCNPHCTASVPPSMAIQSSAVCSETFTLWRWLIFAPCRQLHLGGIPLVCSTEGAQPVYPLCGWSAAVVSTNHCVSTEAAECTSDIAEQHVTSRPGAPAMIIVGENLGLSFAKCCAHGKEENIGHGH